MKYILTSGGFKKLKLKEDKLKKELRELRSKKMDTARDCGDMWHDNPMFYLLEMEERVLMRRLSEVEEKLNEAIVQKPQSQEKIVQLGSIVKIRFNDGQEKELTIIDPESIDLDNNKISYNSPVGRALMGAKENDIVVYKSPREGSTKIRVLKIIKGD